MILACPVANKPKSDRICADFIEGSPRRAFGWVFYGVNESNAKAWHIAMASGEPWYYIDNSYFDIVRGQQYRVTKSSVQKRVGNETSDGSRFEALGLTIAPWKGWGPQGNRNWLAVEQSPSFMATVARDPRWLEKAFGGYHIERNLRVRRWSADKLKMQTSLAEDLAWADTVVAHSSAASVEAVMAGVNAFVSNMSAVHGMKCSKDAHLDERRRYLSVLADNQFSLSEIREGKAWAWLNRN